MEEINMEVGRRLAEIRKSKKLKQEDLKDMIKAPTVQMISSWENGHSYPSTNYLIVLAKKLDISLDYLLLGKQANKKDKKIFTFKDAAEYMLELENSDLFEIEGQRIDNTHYITLLKSYDKTIAAFKMEFDNLKVASKTLRPELYQQAITDLLNKYDFSLVE